MSESGDTVGRDVDAALVGDAELDLWGVAFDPDEPRSLADLVNRVLDRGVVISGDVTISVAGVDLIYLQLHALLTSISTARRSLHPRRREEEGRSAG